VVEEIVVFLNIIVMPRLREENKICLMVVNNIVIVIINCLIDSTNVMMDYSD
jgi:hypothetical protein